MASARKLRWTCLAYAWTASALLGVPDARSLDLDADPSARRMVPGKQLTERPVIDGDVSDAAWQHAAAVDTFYDSRVGKAVDDQTKVWIAYDVSAIYVAFHCFDPQTDRLVMRETKRDGNIDGDDNVSFELDAFHTHNWDDFASFRITPRGTLSSRINSGRSGKTEWKGDWEGAARVVEDGWTAEIAIPWSILSYPGGDEPATLGFNVWRHHARLNMDTVLSDVGPAWRHEYAGNWIGVSLPEGGFSPELLALPFLAMGAAERDGVWEGTARGGLDVRYRPTPMLTGVLTFNPDFRNVQGEVEGIDFSRGERWVGETRPFFQEGRNTLETSSGVGSYFYSRRIESIDLAGKMYGKLAKRTNIALLGTVDFEDQFESKDPWQVHRHDYAGSLSQGFGETASASVTSVVRREETLDNTVLGYRANKSFLRKRLGVGVNYGSSRFHGIDEDEADGEEDEDDQDPDPVIPLEAVSLRGDVGQLHVGWWDGTFWLDGNLTFLSPGFRARDGFIEYPGRRGLGIYGGYWDEWRDGCFTEGTVEWWAGYEERFTTGAGYDDVGGLFERAFSTIGDRDGNERFFNDSMGYWIGFGTRSNLWFSHSLDLGHWGEEGSTTSDFDWDTSFRVSGHSEDQNRRVRVDYRFGRADATFRHFISFGGSYRRDKVTLDYGGSVLRHQDRLHQHIVGLNYDLTTTMTLGGRLVFQRNEIESKSTWNPYVSFRRSGEAGIETFFILGDPSGEKFVPRLEGKVLLPL